MSFAAKVFGPSGSLRRGLVLNIVVALSLCIVMVGAVMIYEFYEHLEDGFEDLLTNEANEIIGQLDPDAPHMGLDPNSLRFRGVEGAFRYTVFDATGALIAGGETSPEIMDQMAGLELGQPTPITLPGDRIAIGLRAGIEGASISVLVSSFPPIDQNTQFNKLIHEIREQIVWVLLAAVIVLTTAIISARNALAPLGQLSRQASEIGPKDIDRRLRTDDVPNEMAPFIQAVNGAFDRLEIDARAQRDFSSNVAHEIRTPLAVLRSSIDRIADPDLRENLAQDVGQLDQIFQQLIDLARADATVGANTSRVDLRDLAVNVATDMSIAALKSGHTLSVTGADKAIVQGHSGLLSIALRNIIRNALQYSPKGTEVEVRVLADPAGWQVFDRGPGIPDDLKTALFERFNRGVQANTKSQGSGIGLAIVKSVATSQAASVSIRDRDGPGSVVSFVLQNAGSFSQKNAGPTKL